MMVDLYGAKNMQGVQGEPMMTPKIAVQAKSEFTCFMQIYTFIWFHKVCSMQIQVFFGFLSKNFAFFLVASRDMAGAE